MSTVTVAATVELGNVPPRVRLDVTDAGSPNLFAATVLRADPDGVQRPVRTNDGAALQLATSGANRTGLVYDYEAPYGSPVTYSTVESPTVLSAVVTVAVGQAWLIHPGVPALSLPIDLWAGSLAEETWDVEQGVYWPMGRQSPVVHTGGVRRSPATSVTVSIESLADLSDLRALVSDAGVLLLNVPAALQLGFPTCYVSVGQIRNRRVTDIGADPQRAVELPIQVVDRPAGGTQAQRTLDDLLSYATVTALSSAYPTLNALLAGP